MKIAVVLNTSWNIFNFRKSLVQSFLEKGHEIHTIAPVDAYTEKLTAMGCIHTPVKMDSRGANPLKDMLLILELFNIYRRIKPDVILHFTIKPNIYGTIAASMLRIPVINNVCGLGTIFLKPNLVSKVAIYMYRFAFRFPKKIFFQNDDDRQLFVSMNLVSEQLCDTLPGSGIDLDEFRPFEKNTGKEKFTFLLISRLIYDKGIREYVEAVSKLRKRGITAGFQVLGAIDENHKRGIPGKTIERWFKDGNIQYLGTSQNVKPIIREADCVVLPSYREGTPRTLLEAASMGLPLIATDVPGCRNVIEEGYNGYLCKPRDARDLAEKMEKMCRLNREELKRLGDNSRKKVRKQFDVRHVIEKYNASIEALSV